MHRSPSAVRVAAKHIASDLFTLLNAPGAVSDKDLQDSYLGVKSNYEEALRSILQQFPEGLDALAQLKPKDVYFSSTYAFLAWSSARAYIDKLTQVKQVPAKYTRLFEKAHRELDKNTKAHETFFAKNQDIYKMLLESIHWPDIQEGDVTRQVGSIRLVNQAGGAVNLDTITKFLTDAVGRIQSSGVPRVGGILYGDVFVVGAIQRNKAVAAYYDNHRDNLFILALPRFSGKELHVLIHEFGHRYWRKDASHALKAAWESHHDTIGSGDVATPVVGAVLPYVNGDHVVTGLDDDWIYVRSGQVDRKAWMTSAKEHQRHLAFPTPYARTNAEEHFCEAFAMHCLGTLSKPHEEAFERIVAL